MIREAFNSLKIWLSDYLGSLSGNSILVIVAAIGLVAFLFLSIQTLRSRKSLRLPPLTSDKKPLPVVTHLGGKVLSWFVQFYGDIKCLFGYSEKNYKTPWVLILGEKNSGISSVAESLKKSNKFNSLLEGNPLVRQRQGWWPFDQGMLIDLQGLIDKSSRKEVVDELMRLRPERPFDGVVLTISAGNLKNSTEQELIERGIDLHDQLSQLQRDFAFTFPVYVLVTKADRIDGFSEFWRAQDTDDFQTRLRQIFGWSNPSSLEAGYSESWLANAFNSMQESLRVEQLRVSVDISEARENELDRFFLFPTSFKRLRAPLVKIFERIFTVNAYQANFFLRGIYFSGKVIDDSEGKLSDIDDETPVAFIEMLFSSKVFAERHLARPIREGIWSRQKQIKRLQQYLIGIGLIAFLALTVASINLKYKVNTVEKVLNQVSFTSNNSNLGSGSFDSAEINNGLSVGHTTCTEFSVIAETLGSLNSLKSGLGSFTIPLSWFSYSLEESMHYFLSEKVINDMMADSMICHLNQQQKNLVSNASLTLPKPETIESLDQAVDSVESYLQKVVELEEALFYWQSFSGKNTASNKKYSDLRELIFLIYNEKMPASVHQNRSLIIDVFDEAEIKSYSMPDQIVTQIGKGVSGQLTDLSNLNGRMLKSGESLVDTYNKNDYLSLSDIRQLAQWIQWIDRNWLPENSQNSVTECEGIRSKLNQELSALDGFKYFMDMDFTSHPLWTDCRQRAKTALSALSIASIGNMLTGAELQTVAPRWQWEAKELDALTHLEFMSAPTGAFVCDASAVRWDNTVLKQMLERMAELSSFVSRSTDLATEVAAGTLISDSAGSTITSSPSENSLLAAVTRGASLSDAVEYPHERLAKRQLAQVLNSLATAAQSSQYSTAVYSVTNTTTPSLSTLRQASQDFINSATTLNEVLQKYIDLGMGEDGTELALCAQNFASSQLNMLLARTNSSAILEPTFFTSSDGNLSSQNFIIDTDSVVSFEGSESPDNWWPIAIENAKSVVSYSQPYVNFLISSKQTYGLNGKQTAVSYYWSNSLSEAKEFDAGSTTGQVSALKSLFYTISGLISDSCSTTIASLPSSQLGLDLFSDRRQQYTELTEQFCRGQVEESGSTVASQLQADFGSIVGKFPFSSSTSLAEARLTDTRNFFLDYAAESDLFASYLDEKQRSVNSASNKKLMQQFNAGVQFFNSHLAVEGTPSALNFSVVFRPNSASSGSLVATAAATSGKSAALTDGSQDVVLWQLTTGIETVKRPPGQSVLSWFYGQPLSFQFRWAQDGNFSPQPDATQSNLSIDSTTKTATFDFTGTWALQRVIAEHWHSGAAIGSIAPKTVRLRFDVPVSSSKSENNTASDTTAIQKKVALYVDLTVTTTSSTGQAIPVFVPQQLPQTFPKLNSSN